MVWGWEWQKEGGRMKKQEKWVWQRNTPLRKTPNTTKWVHQKIKFVMLIRWYIYSIPLHSSSDLFQQPLTYSLHRHFLSHRFLLWDILRIVIKSDYIHPGLLVSTDIENNVWTIQILQKFPCIPHVCSTCLTEALFPKQSHNSSAAYPIFSGSHPHPPCSGKSLVY